MRSPEVGRVRLMWRGICSSLEDFMKLFSSSLNGTSDDVFSIL